MTIKSENLDIDRLKVLYRKLAMDRATKQEKGELMRMLYENNSLPAEHYIDYIKGRDVDELMELGSLISGFILFGQVIKNLKLPSF